MSSKRNFLPTIILALISLSSGCSVVSRPVTEATSIVMVETIPTETPSVTPTVIVATPSEAESKAIALNLLANNGGCRLPCIWGLMPGITTTLERQSILASYGQFSEHNFSMSGSGSDASKNPGGFGIGVTKDNLRISIGLDYYETDHLIETLSLVADPHRDQKYVYGDSNYSDLIEYYTLPRLLSNYGVPSDVLVIAFPHDIFSKADYEPFSIVVVYSDLGIMAEYISPTQWIGEMVELPTPGLSIGEIARGCPNESRLTLRTWDVKKNIPIKEIASIAAGEGMSETAYDYFVPIQKATSMSINDFYNIFKGLNNDQCLELSLSLWIP